MSKSGERGGERHPLTFENISTILGIGDNRV